MLLFYFFQLRPYLNRQFLTLLSHRFFVFHVQLYLTLNMQLPQQMLYPKHHFHAPIKLNSCGSNPIDFINARFARIAVNPTS